MEYATRLLAFAAGLALLFAASFGVGGLIDVTAPGASAEGSGGHMENGAHGEEGDDQMEGMDPVRGLGVAEHGLRLVVAEPELVRGATEELRFQIVDESGHALTGFDLTHTKRMHVIVIRRDLTDFQHLHPEMSADGTWTVPLRLAEAGTYRVFADFSVDGEATTLADDLRVDGDADLRPLPRPAVEAVSEPGGYTVALRAGDPRAGEEASLRFEVSGDGRPVVLQPYLGAGGHLVALREGDLAFLHVHPTGDGGEDGSIEFEATFPTAGRYRLFLQFRVGGELQTVAFTEAVR